MRTTKVQISLRIRSFKILASFCIWAGRFESYLIKNPRRQVFSWWGSNIKAIPWKLIYTGVCSGAVIEPAHEIMELFVLRKLILQTRMRSHLVGLDVSFLVGPFVYFHISSVRTAKALARLAWAFAGRLCDKYHTLMSTLSYTCATAQAGLMLVSPQNRLSSDGPVFRSDLGTKTARGPIVLARSPECWGYAESDPPPPPPPAFRNDSSVQIV